MKKTLLSIVAVMTFSGCSSMVLHTKKNYVSNEPVTIDFEKSIVTGLKISSYSGQKIFNYILSEKPLTKQVYVTSNFKMTPSYPANFDLYGKEGKQTINFMINMDGVDYPLLEVLGRKTMLGSTQQEKYYIPISKQGKILPIAFANNSTSLGSGLQRMIGSYNINTNDALVKFNHIDKNLKIAVSSCTLYFSDFNGYEGTLINSCGHTKDYLNKINPAKWRPSNAYMDSSTYRGLRFNDKIKFKEHQLVNLEHFKIKVLKVTGDMVTIQLL